MVHWWKSCGVTGCGQRHLLGAIFFFPSLSQITRILPRRCLAMIVLCNAPRFFRTCATWLSLTNLVESEAGKMRIIPTAFEQEPD